MNDNGRVQDIDERALAFAARAIKLYGYLQKREGLPGQIIGKQFMRAATSIGANLAEAQAGETRSDFIHKCAIALKETRESLYWLRLMIASELISADHLASITQEAHEIAAILTTIIRKAKMKAKATA